MDSISATAVLTAMITPAVLISACGSMILSTSSRLGRVVDRVRALSDRLEDMSGDTESSHERKAVIFDQLDKLTSRARILQRSMVAFYLGWGCLWPQVWRLASWHSLTSRATLWCR